jgi:hypothetical protein
VVDSKTAFIAAVVKPLIIEEAEPSAKPIR